MATTDTAERAEEGEACLGCTKKRCDVRTDDVKDARLKSALRKVTFLTAITAVLCVLTLAACGCCIFLYYKVDAMRTEIIVTVKSGESDDYVYDPEYLVDDQDYQYGIGPPSDGIQADQADPSGRERRKKGGRGNGCKGGKQARATCKCCVRKVRSLIQSGNFALPTPQRDPKTTTKAPPMQEQKKEQQVMRQKEYISNHEFHMFGAAHYTTFVDNEYIASHFPPLDTGNLANTVKCKNVTEWNGQLCRNRTFSAPAAPTTLRMFKEAAWMSNATKIFDFHSNGTFVAKYTGVYLLYAHVLFYDVKTKQALGLLHESPEGNNQFRCMESVDYVNPDIGMQQNAKYKSCSVNGVLYIKAGDSLQVQSLYANTDIDLTVDATYFGGVLLSTRLDGRQ